MTPRWPDGRERALLGEETSRPPPRAPRLRPTLLPRSPRRTHHHPPPLLHHRTPNRDGARGRQVAAGCHHRRRLPLPYPQGWSYQRRPWNCCPKGRRKLQEQHLR
ncbi:expressed unknown protein [Seminavis robusta]|uniref:Uncharacterized protein n=1 Tax=Seminavis robusta TaxID=568900 RepID=A0A9N8F3P2_9STRA|nr:expressed unknown protein [Seminavis robusta]|eukprot:Sro3197_g345011.1  (105) ;mRNA; r:7658-7972